MIRWLKRILHRHSWKWGVMDDNGCWELTCDCGKKKRYSHWDSRA